eukprot:1140087-Pelagomonas_calceolata.AAC.4
MLWPVRDHPWRVVHPCRCEARVWPAIALCLCQCACPHVCVPWLPATCAGNQKAVEEAEAAR